MEIDKILPFEHDISKTVDIFWNQKISIDSVDFCELFEHKTCQKTCGLLNVNDKDKEKK